MKLPFLPLARTLVFVASLIPLNNALAQANTWSSKASLSTASYGLGGAFVNGKVYAISGFATTRVEAYDPVANSWSGVAGLPTLLQYFGTAVLDGKIYVAGGDTGGGGDRATLYRYDPIANSWSTLASMPLGARYGLSAVALNGKIYALGGYSIGSSAYLSRVEVYDPTNNTWSTGVSLPSPRFGMLAGTINGKIYVAGGSDASGGLTNALVFDPSTNGWSTLAPMPVPSGGNAVVSGGRLFAIGGGSPETRVLAYSPTLNSWTTNFTWMPTGRHDLGVASDASGKVYAFGGWNGSYVSALEVYTPSTTPLLVSTNFFGGSGDQRAAGIAVANGAAFVAGTTDANGTDGLAIRYNFPLNSSATAAWAVTWPGAAGGDEFNGVSVSADAMYVAGDSYARTTDSVGGKENKGIVVRFPLTGGTGSGFGGSVWDHQTPSSGAFPYGGGEALWASLLTVETNNSYIYVTGSGQQNGANGGRLYVSKVDTNGTTLWTQNDSASMVNNAYSIGRGLAALNGNIYVAGFNSDSGNKAYLRKYDPAGNLIWSRTTTSGSYVGVTAFGGAIFAVGSVGSASTSNGLLDKWDEDGNLLWSQTYDRNSSEDSLNAVVGLGSRVYAAGYTLGTTAGGKDSTLLEIDPYTGALVSTTLYGGTLDDAANGIATDGSDLYIAGESRSYGTGGNEFMVLRYTPTAPDAPNIAPSISVLSPTNGATVSVGSPLSIFVNATDSDGTVARVDYFTNGVFMASTTNLPFGFTWTNLSIGSYTIKARVADNFGALSLSAPVSITVNAGQTNTATTVVGFVSIGSQAAAQMAINPNTDRIYIAGGYAQSPLTIINASVKNSPTVVTTVSSGGGVAVNPNLNRFYASSGYSGGLLVYDGVSNSQITNLSIGYCGGQLDFDPVRNLVYLASQCGGGNDPMHIFDANVNALVAGPLGSGGVANNVHVNSATGRSYMSRSGGTRVFGASPGFAFVTDLSSVIAGINPISNLLYLQSGADLQVLDGATHALVATVTNAGSASVGINTNRNRIYVSDGSSQIKIINGTNHTVLSSFSLGTGVVPSSVMAVDSTKNRLYVVGTSNSVNYLYIVEDGGNGPLAITGTTLPSGVLNQTYNVQMSASGGVPSYTWALASGSLPGGVTVSASGLIQGAPSGSGTFNFALRVTDNSSQSVTQNFSIVIAAQGALQLVSTNFVGGTGDQRGVGISIAGGAAYLVGLTDANGVDGLGARFNLPATSAMTPAWTLTWPGVAGGDEFNAVSVSADAMYVAGDSYARTTDSVGGKENKGIVVRFPLTGGTGSGFGGSVWDHQTPSSGAFPYGGGEALWASLLTVETNNSYIYVTGSGQQNGANGGRLYVSKVDTNGTTLWTQNDSASMVNNAYSIGRGLAALNGNIYVAGFNGDSGNKGYLRKYDASGTLLWSRATTPGAYNAVTTFGGAIFAAGSVGSGTNSNGIVDKWDESGNLLWSQSFDRNNAEDLLNGIIGLGSRIYAVGSTRGNTAGGSDAMVLEIDPSSGALLSSALYGGVNDDAANGVATDGTDLYVVGESRSFGGGGNDMMLLRYSPSQSALPLTITSQILGSGQVNQPYSFVLQASGGTLPYVWAAVSNAPAGLSISNNGAISGTATNAGTFTFGVRVTDGTALSVTQTVSVTIAAASVAPVQLVVSNLLSSAVDQRALGLAVGGGQIVLAGITASNSDDGFLASYSAAANPPTWSVTWPGSSGGDHFFGVALGPDGVYVAGDSYARTSDTLGGKENKGIVVKFPLGGPTGAGYGGAAWDAQTPGAPGAFSYGGGEGLWNITVANEGGTRFVYATGNGQANGANGGRFYLSKVDTNGVHLWTVTDSAAMLNNAYSSGRAVVALNGSVYVAGYNGDNGSRPFLRKYDSNGTLVWVRTGTAGWFNGLAIYAGGIFAVGQTASGTNANFLIDRYDENGSLLWEQQYDRNSSEDLLNGVVGLGSRVYAVGSTRGISAGGSDAIVLEINPTSGELLSSTLFGGALDDSANAVATDGTNLFVAGESRSFGAVNRAMLLKFVVNQPSATLSIFTTTLPQANFGKFYSTQIGAAGGAPPYTWALATNSAALPAGMSFSTNGILFGTPTVSGAFNLAFQVSDAQAATAQQSFTLTIIPSNALPIVTVTSPTNGATFTAPATISMNATAADSDGTIARVDFYEGSNIVGTAASAPYSLSLSNKQAGSYALRALAVDNYGASNISSAVVVTVNANANVKNINFDPLTQSPSSGVDLALSNYLSGFGIILSNYTAGTRLNVIDQSAFYGGGVVLASSPNNVFTQVGSNDPVYYVLNFTTPLSAFGLTRAGLIAGSSGITHPWWRAHAYDSSGVELAAVGEELIASYSNVPAKSFSLIAPSGSTISSVRVESENRHFAAFNAVLLDDFILTTSTSTNTPPTVTLTSPANGATYTAGTNVVLTATASDADGSVRLVQFYFGTNTLVATLTNSPYTITLSNVAAGTYSVRAVATDNLGATRSSAQSSFTVGASVVTTLINFDALNAVAGNVSGTNLTAYLATYGITVSNVTFGSRLDVVNSANMYGGQAVLASSPDNFLTQAGLNEAVRFTVNFTNALQSFSFTRPKLLAGPSGITHPQWTARAFDSTGVELGAVGEGITSSFQDVPTKTFTLYGPGITSVRFDSDGFHFAAFSAVLLDDFVLNTTSATSPPVVGITSPANNASYTAPATVVINATATSALGISRVEFYLGKNAVGSVSNSPYNLTLTNVPTGNYNLSARAVDTVGASTSASVAITVGASTVSQTLGFDILNATAGEVAGTALTNYFAAFGVTVSNVSAGTHLAVLNDANIYGGQAAQASSRSNLLTQVGSNDPVSYTLRFAQTLQSFQFTRPKLIAGPSGITHPYWKARAFDVNGVEIASVEEALIASYSDVAPRTVTLNGPGIASVSFYSENRHFAAFNAMLVDDLVLNTGSTNTPPLVDILSPLAGSTFIGPTNVNLLASASDADGTVARVDFYANGSTLIGSASNGAPFSAVWTNAQPGAYLLTATATDNLGATRTSTNVAVSIIPAVFNPPTISTQPQGQAIAASNNVSFTVVASGQAPLFYQWRLNGANLGDATNSTYSVTNARPSDSGSYDVVVANSAGAVASQLANLVVSPTDSGSSGADNDYFTNRVAINPLFAPTVANNVKATREPGEPDHAGKPAGKSIWFTWHATFTGVMALTTRGSGFDTVLAVYTGTNVNNLTLVAADDDSGGNLNSLVTFNCTEGVDYQIAVDGVARGNGNIVIGLPAGGYRVLKANGTVESVPLIITPPQSQSVALGADVQLSVTIASSTPAQFQWYLNAAPIPLATNSSFTITNLQEVSVGRYTVLVANETGSTRSQAAFVEIAHGSNGRSESKFSDLYPPSGQSQNSLRLESRNLNAPTSISAGSLGSQVFCNFQETTKPGEPLICGVRGGATRWFSLRPASSGVLIIDTIGSDFDTLLAVYSGNDLLTLTSVACDNNSAPDGLRSLVQFNVTAATDYSVQVDGVNGSNGNVKLNWRLGTLPVFSQSPTNQSALQGASVTFSAAASGTPAPGYQWKFNGTAIAGATNATLTITNMQSTNAGSYSVVATNFIGTATSSTALLAFAQPLVSPDSAGFQNGGATFRFTINGLAGTNYVVEGSTNLTTWVPLTNFNSSGSAVNFIDSASSNLTRRFYRARPQ